MLPTFGTPQIAYFNGPQDWFVLVMTAFVFIPSVFWIVELVDAARRQFADPNMKLVWIIVICLAHGAGALAYYLVGKRQGYLPGEGPNRW